MRTSNLIHHLVFDLSFADAQTDGTTSADWIKSSLLPIIDQVLEDVCIEFDIGSNKVKRIEKLEIDLGCILQAESESELARRLHAQLRNTLYFHITDPDQNIATQETTTEAHQDLLDFLQTGQISWKSLSDRTSAHKKLLQTVLNRDLSNGLLGSVVSNQRQLLRLVRQFDTATLFAILRQELRDWPEDNQDLLFDWLSLELITLNGNLPLTEQFWLSLLPIINSADKTFNAVIQAWLAVHQKNKNQVFRIYQNFLEKNSDLSRQSRTAMNEAIQKIREATATPVSLAELQADKISDELTCSHRIRILVSRKATDNAESLSFAKKSKLENISSPSILNAANTENTDDGNKTWQTTTALTPIDSIYPMPETSLVQLLKNGAESLRAQHNYSWTQWLNEFPITSCLDLIAILQEHCSEYILKQLKKNLHTLSKECLDQLVTYALSARVNSLEVVDLERMLTGNRTLTTPFPKQVHGPESQKSVGIEKNETTPEVIKKAPQSQILSALRNADIPRLSGLWNLLINKHPALILKLLPDHKIQWLDHFPLHFLSDIGRIVQTEASRVWQPKIQLGYHGQIDAATRAGFDILFTAKTQTLSVQSFIAKIKILIQEQPSLADILQSIVENATTPSPLTHHAPVTTAAKLATTVVDNETDNYTTVSTLQSALCSNDISTLSTAIEYALANDMPLLIRIRHQHWRRWWKNLPKHLLHLLILQLHASIRPEFQAILQAKNGISFSTIERLIPLLLASPENSFSREQLNAIIELDEKPLEISDADNAKLVTNTSIRNSGNTNDVPDELNELTIAFQRADIHRINAIWPALIARHTRQLQSTWFSLTYPQRNTLIAQLPIEKQFILIQILYPELAHYIKELRIYAPVLAETISDSRIKVSSFTEKISANSLLENICTFCLQMEPSSPRLTIKAIFIAVLSDKLNSDEDNLRSICDNPKLADTKYLRNIFSYGKASLTTEITPLSDSFRAWQQNRIQLQKLHLTREELLRYLHWLMWHQNANDGKDFSLMLASIKETEKNSSAPELFLQCVLEAFKNGENIDIESLRKKAENQPTTSRQQSQPFGSTTDDPAGNRPKNLNEEYFASANHETSATQPTLMENIELLNQVDQALLSKTGWSDLVDLLKQQPEILTTLHSAQLHLFISKWMDQAMNSAISSIFLDEMENLALKTNSIRLFYIGIIRQLLDETNVDLPNLEILQRNLSEISANTIDDLHPARLNDLTAATYLPTIKRDNAMQGKASFSSQLLHLLSNTPSMNKHQPSDALYSSDIAGEKQRTKPDSDIPDNLTTDLLPDLNKLAFRQWTYQWLNLTASSVLDETTSDESQLEISFSNTSTEIFTNLLQAINNTVPASIIRTFQEIAGSSFHLDKQFWSIIDNRERHTSTDDIRYQQCVALINQIPWNELTQSYLPSVQKDTSTNATPDRKSSLSLSTQATLTGQLAHALLHSQLNKLNNIWPELMQYHGDLLAQAQRYYLRRVDLREKLIADNDPAILKDLVATLSDTAALLLDELWQHWEIYRPALVHDIPLLTCQQKSLAPVFTVLLEQKIDAGDISALAAAILTALTGKPLHHTLTQEIAGSWRVTSQSGKTPHWYIALHAIFPCTDWHKQEWQQQLRRQLKQSNPTTTREFWQSVGQHLERQRDHLPPANTVNEELDGKTDAARHNAVDNTTFPLRNHQQTTYIQTTDSPDYVHQAMVIATLKLLTPSFSSPAGDVSKARNNTQTEQATLENWISQCILLLQKHAPLSTRDEQFLNFMLEKIFDMPSSACEEISLALHSEIAITRLIEAASSSTLQRLCDRLAPALSMQLPQLVTEIENALNIKLKLTQSIFLKQTWSAIYRAEFRKSRPVTMQEFVTRFLRELRHIYPLPDIEICLQLLNEYRKQTEIEKVMQTNHQGTETSAQITAEQAMLNRDSYVMNAGLVIVAPYIQRLFGILELTKNSAFIDDAAAERATHILQYIVTGEEQTPEYQLTLNKLLCGIHGGVPIVAGIQMTDHEKEVIQQMLLGVITHWSAIGKTSIQGLRETFLQREGHLYKQEDGWQLHIPSATFDMLLDRLPWSFAMIKFPWMPDPLHVTWR